MQYLLIYVCPRTCGMHHCSQDLVSLGAVLVVTEKRHRLSAVCQRASYGNSSTIQNYRWWIYGVFTSKKRRVYERRHSGGRRINFDYLGLFDIQPKLSARSLSALRPHRNAAATAMNRNPRPREKHFFPELSNGARTSELRCTSRVQRRSRAP